MLLPASDYSKQGEDRPDPRGRTKGRGITGRVTTTAGRHKFLPYSKLVLREKSSSTITGNEAIPSMQRTTTMTAASTERRSETLVVDQRHKEDEWTNAVLSAQHISSTESLLQWKCFDAFPGLRQNKQPIFLIEQQRRPLEEFSPGNVPRGTPHEIKEILEEYRRTINFAYPILTIEEMENIQELLLSSPLCKSISWCRAWLVMALGCASQSINFVSDKTIRDEDAIFRCRNLASIYFGLFLEQSYLIHDDISVVATQCLLFSA